MRKITLVLITALLASCAGMVDLTNKLAGIGTVSEDASSFDNTVTVRMAPAFLYEKGSLMGNRIKLGAVWNSGIPDQVGLIMSYSSDVAFSSKAYTNFDGLEININGDISSYEAAGLTSHDSSGYNSVTHTIYTESSNIAMVSMTTLNAMMEAEDVRIRIKTGDGYQDAHFSIERIPGGQTTAKYHMHEFLSKIAEIRARQ